MQPGQEGMRKTFFGICSLFSSKETIFVYVMWGDHQQILLEVLFAYVNAAKVKNKYARTHTSFADFFVGRFCFLLKKVEANEPFASTFCSFSSYDHYQDWKLKVYIMLVVNCGKHVLKLPLAYLSTFFFKGNSLQNHTSGAR